MAKRTWVFCSHSNNLVDPFCFLMIPFLVYIFTLHIFFFCLATTCPPLTLTAVCVITSLCTVTGAGPRSHYVKSGPGERNDECRGRGFEKTTGYIPLTKYSTTLSTYRIQWPQGGSRGSGPPSIYPFQA